MAPALELSSVIFANKQRGGTKRNGKFTEGRSGGCNEPFSCRGNKGLSLNAKGSQTSMNTIKSCAIALTTPSGRAENSPLLTTRLTGKL